MDEQRKNEILRNLLRYSFEAVDWDYDQLTVAEKSTMTREEFAELREWAGGGPDET